MEATALVVVVVAEAVMVQVVFVPMWTCCQVSPVEPVEPVEPVAMVVAEVVPLWRYMPSGDRAHSLTVCSLRVLRVLEVLVPTEQLV
jgi:hypothetical protein